eukprot:1345281-Rhodomonas_salina.1
MALELVQVYPMPVLRKALELVQVYPASVPDMVAPCSTSGTDMALELVQIYPASVPDIAQQIAR